MNERGSKEESETAPGTKITLGDISVVNKSTGARMAWSIDHSELRVNTTCFPSPEHARRATIRSIALHTGLKNAALTDIDFTRKLIQEYPEASEPVLRWQGLTKLRMPNASLLEGLQQTHDQTPVQEFYWALDTSILTGKYPDNLSAPVKEALDAIPKRNGRSLVDYIASGRYLKFDGQNFTEYIKPLVEQLIQEGKQIRDSKQVEYKPTPPQNLLEGEEPIQESDITVRVSPFYGGYYREQTCRYDSQTRQIIKDAGTTTTWYPDEPPEEEAIWQTKRTYEGVIVGEEDTLLKLPYTALPIVATVTPSKTFQLMRDDLGIISLVTTNKENRYQGTFSFDFVLAETSSNQLNFSPTDQDYLPVGGILDVDTQTLLDDLATQTWISEVKKAQQITSYIQGRLRYPENETEIADIDTLYQSIPPEELWTNIMNNGVAHCYWANILRDELCKRLGIASRIVTGPYVTEDPRFPFAVVSAHGMPEHAWGEIWDSQKEIWVHEGQDATPPEKSPTNDTSDPQKDNSSDFDKNQQELTGEEIKKLFEELTKGNKPAPEGVNPEERAMQQFEREKGVSWQEWHDLEKWIQEVNQTDIPAHTAIKGKPSTLYQEWRDLFDLLYKRRQVPHTIYRGPLTRSEGDILDDPVTAYIDVLSHDDDPSGYQREYQKPREQHQISLFEDDSILDISASMDGVAGEEQRKMVLSSEYNIKQLNERLNHSQIRSHMATPLQIRSRVATFGDETEVIQESEGMITEKGLITLDQVLKDLNQSSGGLTEALKQYRDTLNPTTMKKIQKRELTKVLTLVSDGAVSERAECIALIKQLREKGIIVQGIGFGNEAYDIMTICHDPQDPDAAVVIEDVTQATYMRHKLLLKHLSRL